MKRYKTIDLFGSIALMMIFLVYGLLWRDFTFIYGYFVVGSWQCVSMVVHIWKGWFSHTPGRRIYHSIVVLVFIAAAAGFLYYPILYALLCILLVCAPFMAIYYTILCHHELYVRMQRPLAQLK